MVLKCMLLIMLNAEQSVVVVVNWWIRIIIKHMLRTYTDSLDISGQESNAQDLYFNNVVEGC